MSPEDWKAVGEIATYILTGAGGLFAAQRVQRKLSGSSSGEHEETGSATLLAVERVEDKLDKLVKGVSATRVELDGLVQDVQRHEQDLSRLGTVYRGVAGRVEALESRMTKPM